MKNNNKLALIGFLALFAAQATFADCNLTVAITNQGNPAFAADHKCDLCTI